MVDVTVETLDEQFLLIVGEVLAYLLQELVVVGVGQTFDRVSLNNIYYV